MPKKRKKSSRLQWEEADDIQERVAFLIKALDYKHLAKDRIFCYRSRGSKSRSYARIWGLNRIWQKALGQEPGYVIEVLSEKFDELSEDKKDEVLIHELLHIPKNFSGALLPHHRKGKRNFHDRVKKAVAAYRRMKST
jgi:predicted metallopeptidase